MKAIAKHKLLVIEDDSAILTGLEDYLLKRIKYINEPITI
jgi:hypothetical protein